MELLKDAYPNTADDEKRGSNTEIKEEILTSNEYNDLPGNYSPEEAATSCKDASKEREFSVILDGDGGKHVVRGMFCDSVLTALEAHEYVGAWMNSVQVAGFYLVEKKKDCNVCINLGMPLRYVCEGSQFEMKRYKLKKSKKTNELWYRQYGGKEECTLFRVDGNGSRMESCGAQSRRIIRWPRLLKERCQFLIFAPKEESVRDAVCNDCRFLPMLKEKDWQLVSGANIRPKSSLVKNLPNELFEIHVKTEKGDRRTGLNEKRNCLASSEGQPSTFKKQQRQQHQRSEQGQPSTFKKQRRRQQHQQSEQGQPSTFKNQWQGQYFEQGLLDLYPKLKEQGEIIEKFLSGSLLPGKKKADIEMYKRNFGKEINDSLSIKLVKALARYSQSVGYICWKRGESWHEATCFVLGGGYIMTCHHVVKSIVGKGVEEKDWGSRIKQVAQVTFSYEENYPSENNWWQFEDWPGISDEDLDFAVLKLEENECDLPLGLLHLKYSLPPDGPAFIIGHPGGQTKAMDICLVISIFDRPHECIAHWTQTQENECCKNAVSGYDTESNCIHMYNPKIFEEIINNPNVATYNTSFWKGSSGSPVFNKDGQLVALHAAGYFYKMENKERNIIECGYSIESILSKIESRFKPWYDDKIAPLLISPDAREDSSDVDTSLNKAEEGMECD